MIEENEKKWLDRLKEEYTGGIVPDELGLYLQDWLKEQHVPLTGCSLIDNPIIFEFEQ